MTQMDYFAPQPHDSTSSGSEPGNQSGARGA